jgi:alkane 1-monooxygenase
MPQPYFRQRCAQSPWPFAMVFIVPASVVAGYLLGGGWHWLTPVIVFGAIPLCDHLMGIDPANPFPEKIVEPSEPTPWQVITWLCAPLQVGLVVWGGSVVAAGDLGFWNVLGFTLSMGISSGVVGINASHELQHRVNSRFETGLARLLLMSVGYMHWAIEHVAGHHRHVATPRDPATARWGESFYRFLPRTVIGGFVSAWQIESQRLKRRQHSPRSSHNRMIRYGLVQLFFAVFLLVIWGWPAIPYWLAQSAVAVILLELINYIEHYGLLRERRGAGYAPVRVWHSWNSSHWLTNRFLFNLQRHADHHYRPGRRYPYLRHFAESPQLPTGYAGMLLLALVPFLWRAVMDVRVSTLRKRLRS